MVENQPPKPTREPSVPTHCNPQDGTLSGSLSLLGDYRFLCKGCGGTREEAAFLRECMHCAVVGIKSRQGLLERKPASHCLFPRFLLSLQSS